MAAYLVDIKVFQIKISKNYRHVEFRDDLKQLYMQTGIEGKQIIFLLTDSQIVNELFLENLSNILSSGEVPNLFGPDELPEIKTAMQAITKGSETMEQLYALFIERAKSNMHVVLCMSPVGEIFRRRLRMFPSLVNCTTIDWFSDWPEDALLEVATKYLNTVDLGTEQIKKGVSQMFVNICI